MNYVTITGIGGWKQVTITAGTGTNPMPIPVEVLMPPTLRQRADTGQVETQMEENIQAEETEYIPPTPLSYKMLYDLLRNRVDLGAGPAYITLYNAADGGYYQLFAREIENDGRLLTEEFDGYILWLNRIETPITS